MHTNPHDNEYAAAVSGMADTYGTCTYAVGDRVTFRIGQTGYENGRVAGHKGDTHLYVEVEGRGPGCSIEVIDARPWPTGNVLPF